MKERYVRQSAFKKIGRQGQEKISNASVAIVGCGALGSSSAEILTRAGIKEIVLIDPDIVEENNLQRQSLYTQEDISKPKVDALKSHLEKINGDVEIIVYQEKISSENIDLLGSAIIVDGLDEFEPRYVLNDYANKNGLFYVFGSAIRSEGMTMPVMPGNPCFRCVFDDYKTFEKADTQGVIASAVRTVSALQCALALRLIIGEEVKCELLKFDVWTQEFTKVKPKVRTGCVCTK
ncbi:HesA/MoeB/ThiF family protein [Candidatus Woesearchaeota archaeon]|nr:HesA/MoeB/ThiF family protein [Candidatus Woesearchaeota archaeon]